MSERMRFQAEDALYTLRTLVERGYTLTTTCERSIWTVSVDAIARDGFSSSYYDAGSLADALLKIKLDDYPARAAA